MTLLGVDPNEVLNKALAPPVPAMSPEAQELHIKFSMRVGAEIDRQKKLFPRTLSSHHEGYGVLLEEVDEYWDEVKKKASARDPRDVLEELVQIAAMCSRIAVELGTLEAALAPRV